MRPDAVPPSFTGPMPDLGEPPPPPSRLVGLIKVVLASAVIGLGLAGWKMLAPTATGQWWGHDLAEGIEASRSSGKPLIVFYTADWCPPCRHLKTTTFNAPEIVTYLKESYVRVKIDLTDRGGPNNRIARQHDVSAIPTVIVYDDDGLETRRLTGAPSIDSWLRRQIRAAAASAG